MSASQTRVGKPVWSYPPFGFWVNYVCTSSVQLFILCICLGLVRRLAPCLWFIIGLRVFSVSVQRQKLEADSGQNCSVLDQLQVTNGIIWTSCQNRVEVVQSRSNKSMKAWSSLSASLWDRMFLILAMLQRWKKVIPETGLLLGRNNRSWSKTAPRFLAVILEDKEMPNKDRKLFFFPNSIVTQIQISLI